MISKTEISKKFPETWGICLIVIKGGVRLLTTQQPIKRQGWWKGKVALFQSLATAGWRADSCPNADSLPRHWQSVGKSFNRWGEGLHAETAQSALTVILKLVIGGLSGVILLVLVTVSLQFQGKLVSILWGQFLAYVMATVLSSFS